ncbi:uncharacterized protein (DUF2267 family) [Pseudomonas duriflava]|uniref:Uncharacterized protein (DUF2267 family) n=1 Tax=Pseudomonas duriflava TaxID=459528 RepID=A0A562QE10_9PSED|nr:DUF2267 domain-containing protein [Pseudomonas duriflava]TWI54974.1 uncharacterized protein (DUF2267 family) [Pseudomonas duriflava]
MTSSVEVLDRSIQQTNLWLDDIATHMGAPDRQTAYQALRAVLMAVRDRIGIDNAAHLAAQLPLMIRGIFYENFHPHGTPTQEETRDAFLKKVSSLISPTVDADPAKATKAVLRVLYERIDPNEVAKVAGLFPMPLRSLWPEETDVPGTREGEA